MGAPSAITERRAWRRRPLPDVPHIVEVRIDSATVTVINISSGGLCLESAERLAPGNSIRLQIVAKSTTVSLRCRILRSHVKSLSGCIIYQAAGRFERPLALIDDDRPASGTHAAAAGQVHPVARRRMSPPPPGPVPPPGRGLLSPKGRRRPPRAKVGSEIDSGVGL